MIEKLKTEIPALVADLKKRARRLLCAHDRTVFVIPGDLSVPVTERCRDCGRESIFIRRGLARTGGVYQPSPYSRPLGPPPGAK